MTLPKKVKIVEVSPRDGLQNEQQLVSTSVKIKLIDLLVDAGVCYIEAGSFVSPGWVPQMANSDDVLRAVARRKGVVFAALTPNLQGFNRAIVAGVDEVAIFATASESFSRKNINCSIDESLKRFEAILEPSIAKKIPVRAYISCVAGCPYEGRVSPQKVAKLAARLYEMGCYEVSLGDTIGVGTPDVITRLIENVAENIPIHAIAVHMHDTYGQALANIYTALLMGIAVIDSSVSGLGGCPYVKNSGDISASGNVATEDLVYMLNGLGIKHGINLEKIIEAGRFISMKLGKDSGSKVSIALT
jgi:hydroxymethylglutaryl-CoA lyase|tara:strand:- start:340 stop:1248 length:909 start_codon:yes stop_codon:yes gene_type:complete